jgi:hypothetical protein
MALNYYFKDRAGAQNGPLTLDELKVLAQTGRIPPEALVWSEGGEPRPASAHPELSGFFTLRPTAGAGGVGPLQSHFPVWGLFWRAVVYMFASVLIIPAPWAGLWFYRFLAENVALPGGRRLRLESGLGECWWIFAGIGLAEVLGQAFSDSDAKLAGSLAALFLSVWLTVRLVDWFCRSLRAEGGGLALQFEGGTLAYLGWALLTSLAMVTVIGWAWVLKYMLRWLCEKVVGTHAFEFVGSGLELLWRTLLLALALGFILPFPWALRWYADWFVSQIVVSPRAASAAGVQAVAA